MALTNPKSRKAKQLKKKELRKEELTKRKRTYQKERITPAIDRLTWLQLYLPGYLEEINKRPLIKADLGEILQRYVDRNSEEIQSEAATGRERTHIKAMKLIWTREKAELASGILIPDLTDEATLLRFSRWDGDYNGIQSFKQTKVKKQ